MSPQLQKVKILSQTTTVDKKTVSVRDALEYSPPAARAVAFLQGSLWPLSVIAAGTVSSVLWTAALFWLVSHVLW